MRCIVKQSKYIISKQFFCATPYSQVPNTKYTNTLEIKDTTKNEPFGVYRCLNLDGTPVDKDFKLPMSEDEILNIYECMVTVRIFDDIFYKLARMNLISFYMQNYGEEAAQIGSIAALTDKDYILSQYRELGSFIYRGVPLQQLMDINYSNNRDVNCGKQMPVHYGSYKHNMVTISSTLSTQMPQATGIAYGIKRNKYNSCVLCYFGEGASSEGDAMVGFNFSATLKCPILWFCRNNGWAISTPAKDQYCGDGIVARAYGYGMYACRFDGNDIFATYIATKQARNICINESRPVILEAMTYRAGHHSTSDDSKTYRDSNEEQMWNDIYSPILRLKKYLLYIGLWNETKDKELKEKIEYKIHELKDNAQ